MHFRRFFRDSAPHSLRRLFVAKLTLEAAASRNFTGILLCTDVTPLNYLQFETRTGESPAHRRIVTLTTCMLNSNHSICLRNTASDLRQDLPTTAKSTACYSFHQVAQQATCPALLKQKAGRTLLTRCRINPPAAND